MSQLNLRLILEEKNIFFDQKKEVPEMLTPSLFVQSLTYNVTKLIPTLK
jgi:hypothetical protein